MKNKFVLSIAALLLLSALSFISIAAELTGTDYLAMANRARVQAVTSLIDGAKAGGVKVKQTTVSYCRKLDAFYTKNPAMKSRDLAIVLKTLIIMEYDWTQKGVDKDQLAREFLGDKLYQENKTRLGKK